MSVIKYRKFELPKKIRIEEGAQSDVQIVIVEPMEKGFGHTLGNAFRRILLTFLEAPAIVSVDMEGVYHEYTSIDGIIEDMIRIILNCKKVRLRKLCEECEEEELEGQRLFKVIKELDITQEMIDQCSGTFPVTSDYLFQHSPFEVINPEFVVFSVTKPIKKYIAFKVMIGRGYKSSEMIELPCKDLNEIVIDALFSPIILANYFVESCRVGDRTDMDKLLLEVKTDGRISVREAVIFASQILAMHLAPFEESGFHKISCEEDQENRSVDKDLLWKKLSLKISEIELSVRSTNCLIQANVGTLAELVVRSEPDLLRCRNFGKKSLNEIKSKLAEMGLHLDMDLSSKYGISKDNVKEIMEKSVDVDEHQQKDNVKEIMEKSAYLNKHQ